MLVNTMKYICSRALKQGNIGPYLVIDFFEVQP